MSEHISHVTDSSFKKEVLESNIPVLVDFWAEWCGPCKMVQPVLEQIASDSNGKFKIVKLNVDENALTPAEFSIRGIPTLLLFKEGQLVATKVGAVSKSQLTTLIEPHLMSKQ